MLNSKDPLARRDFLKTAAGVAAGAASPLAASAAEEGARKGKPKIGCVSWCFHSFDDPSGPEKAIPVMGEIGFEGTDLILLSRGDMEGYWTEGKIDRIRKMLGDANLAVSQFVIYQPVIAEIMSPDPGVRERNLDFFEAGCRIGRKLEAPIIDIVAPWPVEMRGPTSYLPRHYEMPDAKPGGKFHLDIDEDFSWEEAWARFVEVTRACLERVKAHGMKFTIEHHTHCMVHDAMAFLRLWDEIQDPALGYSLDTGWTLSQREYPPLAIHKTRDHLMNLHVRDIDGAMRKFVHFGTGVMDFRHIAGTLKQTGFGGYLSIEQDKHPGDMRATCERYLKTMREYLS